ncbi:response regulator transcription factor [Zobellella maritima]|uniref:response regulator transcription factor n=1 Tax=Zobellella maritima TaxID=2059725 RepID=UPI001E2FB39C|nr:LuxR C-terminal-related transcriptional regulator [Zobellella maritima]
MPFINTMRPDIAPASLAPLARVLAAINSEQFLPQLRACLEDYFPGIDLVLCRLHVHRRPDILLHNLSDRQWRKTLHPYCAGMYLLDPFYQHWLNRATQGVFTLDEIAPGGFRHSEYFSTYYTELGLHDELMCFFAGDQMGSLAFSFGFYRRPDSLDKQTLSTQMRYLFPLLQALLEQHQWQWQSQQEESAHQGLATFAAGQLSEREQEVTRLILQGYSSNAIAEHLSISPGTVKNHRKHIYSKLGINSQSMLFQLFLQHQGVNTL